MVALEAKVEQVARAHRAAREALGLGRAAIKATARRAAQVVGKGRAVVRVLRGESQRVVPSLIP